MTVFWRTSCGAPLVLPILSNSRPEPRLSFASLPEVQNFGNDGDTASFGSAGDHAGSHTTFLRNVLLGPVHYVRFARLCNGGGQPVRPDRQRR